MPKPPAPKTLTIDKDGPIPWIDVHVGHQWLADYLFVLWTPAGRNPRVAGRGINTDEIEDRFRLVKTRDELAKLHGHILDGVVWPRAWKRGDNPYFLEVEIQQKEETIGSWQAEGKTTSSALDLRETWIIKLA